MKFVIFGDFDVIFQFFCIGMKADLVYYGVEKNSIYCKTLYNVDIALL